MFEWKCEKNEEAQGIRNEKLVLVFPRSAASLKLQFGMTDSFAHSSLAFYFGVAALKYVCYFFPRFLYMAHLKRKLAFNEDWSHESGVSCN